jgi:HSP20 family protein
MIGSDGSGPEHGKIRDWNWVFVGPSVGCQAVARRVRFRSKQMTKTMATALTGMPLPAPFLNAFREAMERLAEGPLAPGLDLYTTPEAIVAEVALPGVKRENVDISVGDDLVTICGTVREEQKAGEADYVHRELSHGSFSRSFWLPIAVRAEAATASLKDGLLTLTLPKTDHPMLTQVKVAVG